MVSTTHLRPPRAPKNRDALEMRPRALLMVAELLQQPSPTSSPPLVTALTLGQKDRFVSVDFHLGDNPIKGILCSREVCDCVSDPASFLE